MKTKNNTTILIILSSLFILLVALFIIYFFGTGFTRNTSVGISDFSVSKDGSEMTVEPFVASSAGYIRSMSVKGVEDGILQVDCYSAFGGINGRLGAKDVFTLPLAENVTGIALYRGSGGYEEVLSKTADGGWVRVLSGTHEPGPASISTITVSDVDGFLQAIGSNTEVVLAPGEYDLSTASDYGRAVRGASYSWQETAFGYMLVISGVHDFSVIGSGIEKTSIVTPDSYAYVLYLQNTARVTLSGFTAGHTAEPDTCGADVLSLYECDDTVISDCDLYGCGVCAICADDCSGLTLEACVLRDCSNAAVSARYVNDLRLVDCDILRCGNGNALSPLISVMYCDGAALVNSRVSGNRSSHLVNAYGAREVYVLGSEIADNRITEGMFATGTASPVVEGCSFTGNLCDSWYDISLSDSELVNSAGEALRGSDLYAMEREPAGYAGPKPAPEGPAAESVVPPESVYTVSDVDGLLAALGSDRRIELEPGIYDLSTASTYGRDVIAGYHWEIVYDGPELVLNGLKNLEITGTDPAATVICAIPRYANVLSFDDCENVSVSNITFGHTEEPGYCAGGVLYFNDSSVISVDGCVLYGCGILGIDAECCDDITVTGTEIYDCSSGAVFLNFCRGAVFSGNNVHDCAQPDFNMYNSSNVTVEGQLLDDGDYYLFNYAFG